MGFNWAFDGLKLHFLLLRYQVNGFVLYGKIIAIDFYLRSHNWRV